MSQEIGPGDWVECVDNTCEGEIRFGQIYRVSHFSEYGICSHCGDDGPSVELVEVEETPDAGFCCCQFRPIYRPKSEIIEALKHPAPERETEDA